MKKKEHTILFDHYLTEQLGFWLRHSPDVPLPLSVFYNLLSSDTVLCFDEHLYPEEIIRGPWKKELKELESIDKISILRRTFNGKDLDSIFFMPLELTPLGRFEDTISLLWCLRQNIPFRISDHSLDHLDYVTEQIRNTIKSEKIVIDDPTMNNTCLKWIVNVEVPDLERRSQAPRIEAFKKGIINVENNPDMTYLLNKAFWDFLQNSVFLTPTELIDLLKQKEKLQALREMVSRAVNSNLTEPDIHSILKEHWDKLLGRFEACGWFFTGIDISIIPLGLSGPITKPGQILINHFIKKKDDWLLSLNTFNKRLRKKSKSRKK